MHYIYCYINKVNNHKYVGQTNNLKRRIRQHASCALNPKASSYNHLIHQKLRQYGIENFEIKVLEQIYENDTVDYVNQRENFWIKKLNTYCGNNEGYNMDLGGNNKDRQRKITQAQEKQIKELLKKGTPFIEIQNLYNISATLISNINTGYYYYDSTQTYPLYKYYKEDKDYDELIDLLLNSDYSFSTLAKMLDMGASTIKKINAGTLRHGLYPSYPIRKLSSYELKADKVKKILKEQPWLSNLEIAIMANVSEETVRRINLGITHNDPTKKYPLRTCNDYPGLDREQGSY